MKSVLTFSLALLSLFTLAESTEVDSKIKEVTVFVQAAQITRTFETQLQSGNQVLKIHNLSPFIDAKTIQIKGLGEFKILSIRHQLNFLNQGKMDKEIKAIFDSLDFYKKKFKNLNNELEVIGLSENFLHSNKMVKGQEQLNVEELAAVHKYYIDELRKLKEQRTKLEYVQTAISKSMERIRKQLNELNKKLATTTGEVLVEIESDKAAKGDFEMNYIVGHAGWYPSYDLRVDDINSPIQLSYKANVHQNTGVSWDNVKLTFSNADPYESNDLPNLVPYRLDYITHVYRSNSYQNSQNSYDLNNYVSTTSNEVRGRVVDQTGKGVPFVMVMVYQSSIGASTDENGYFDIILPPGSSTVVVNHSGYDPITQNLSVGGFNQITLQSDKLMPLMEDSDGDGISDYIDAEEPEVAATRYASSVEANISFGRLNTSRMAKQKRAAGGMQASVIEYQTSVSIEVEEPYTIESGGKMRALNIGKEEIPAYYEYRSVPKLEKAAFLIARVADWGGYNLMEGQANLYFENTYIGKTILDVRFLTDTLNISLGRDKNVLVTREKIKSTSSRVFLGSDHIEKREFEIKVRNNKGQSINLIIYDQVPISGRPKDIEVTVKSTNSAIYNETTGELKWEVALEPNKEFSRKFSYQVKFPKNTEINLE